jgi:hypothetical protein
LGDADLPDDLGLNLGLARDLVLFSQLPPLVRSLGGVAVFALRGDVS